MAHNNRPPLGDKFVRTNFPLLKKDYVQIADILPGSAQEFPSYRFDVSSVHSRRILFHDMSYLTCVEMSNADDELLQYYYEWYNPDRQLIMKFHAHYHPDDAPEEIRKYDPFHIHKKQDAHDLKLIVREANSDLRGIRQIINYIIQAQYAVIYY